MKGKVEILFDINRLAFNVAGKFALVDSFLRKRYVFSTIKKNKVLENKPENQLKTCYIIGLGPSLKDVDLDKIDGDSIVVNRFYKVGERFPQFVPTYYVISDAQFINDANIEDFERCLNMYDGKRTKYFLHSRLSKHPIVDKYNSNKIYYISSITGLINVKKNYSISKPTPILFNSVGTAIFLAISMGYKKVVLLGCDFNSFATPIPQHCYSENKEGKLRSLSTELFCYSFVANAHEDLQHYAIKRGVKIINSTKGSLIDTYPTEIDESLYI